MKYYKLFSAMLVVALLLTSCKGEEKKNTGAEGNSQNAVLKVGINMEPDSFDPFLFTASETDGVMRNVFEGLVTFDSKGEIVPKLAKSWDIEEDCTSYTFYLNDNVYFHNDIKFTSDDVVYTYSKLAGLNGYESLNSKYKNVEDVTKIDDHTVKIKLKEKDVSFLTKALAYIVQKDYEDNETIPVGTGTYMFEKYNPGDSVEFSLFEKYYNDDNKGKISKIEFIVISDENVKINSLRTGKIDIFESQKEVIDQVPDEFDKYHNYSNMVQVLALNNDIEPFNNKNVRQAINIAINRDEISDIVSNGEAYILYTTFSPATKWYNAETEKEYTIDVEKAKDLLKQEGYENGFEMEIVVPSNYHAHIGAAQIIMNQLEKIGIKSTIKQVEMMQWLTDVNTNGNYEASVIGLSGKIDPSEIAIRFQSQYKGNFFHYNNPEYDELYDKAMKETDVTEREKLYNEMQMILTKDSAAIFTMDPGRDIACVKNLKGYVFYPVTYWDLSALYFE